MYIPAHFAVTDKQIIEAFLKENTFATLITSGDSYPMATHTPVVLETSEAGDKVLRGHIAKANLQWRSFEKYPNVLVTFVSPVHHYISSSWYQEDEVPTWNYLSAQITGTVSLLEGQALWEALKRLTDTHESRYASQPIDLESLPEHVREQINGVVGFEIRIEKMELAFKLSQNRTETDFENILTKLRRSNSPFANSMATVMEQHRASRNNFYDPLIPKKNE